MMTQTHPARAFQALRAQGGCRLSYNLKTPLKSPLVQGGTRTLQFYRLPGADSSFWRSEQRRFRASNVGSLEISEQQDNAASTYFVRSRSMTAYRFMRGIVNSVAP